MGGKMGRANWNGEAQDGRARRENKMGGKESRGRRRTWQPQALHINLICPSDIYMSVFYFHLLKVHWTSGQQHWLEISYTIQPLLPLTILFKVAAQTFVTLADTHMHTHKAWHFVSLIAAISPTCHYLNGSASTPSPPSFCLLTKTNNGESLTSPHGDRLFQQGSS